MQDLQMCAQEKLTWWDQLVKVTGSELNPKKCCGLIYTWSPDRHGILQFEQPELQLLSLSLPFKNVQQPITILQNNEGTQYLGLYITADCNLKPMESHLWHKAQTYTVAFHRTPMSRQTPCYNVVSFNLNQ